jgi:tetratricopeptide (TPR) repeat protein/predicted Ser/Thr protein kinase
LSDLLSRLQSVLSGSYRIERELGGGGMSRVFLAEETRLGRRVVIKVLPPEMAADVNIERFEREIQLAARLQHPHIVPLLTAGSDGDLLYYVMPFIEGESLRAKLAREGELPVGEAAKILREVLDALAYAHGHGVVHRDIKPDNVLLSGKHAVVTDFGVAKAVSASTGVTALTSLGIAIGTPAYMAPEQATADPHVDHRADIYAAGALAYEMLCGRPPFSGPTPQAVLAAHVTQAPDPVTVHRDTVPASLAELVMRCLQKKPADRWQSADDVLPQLDAVLTPSGCMTPTGRVPTADWEAEARKAHPVRVTGLFTLAAVGALAIVYLLVQQLGLPWWVLIGTVVILAVGLPVVAYTGHRERRRVVARSAGVQITPAGGLHRIFTWRRAAIGGGVAFGGLALIAAAYMAMRLIGIGPVGTLVATGVLEERDVLILADFEDRTPDASLGTSVTEAFRIDLSQSPVVRLMGAATIGEALTRMNRSPTGTMNAELATEIARREGVKAVVVGEIGMLGSGYVISTSMVSSDDRSVLVALRETADDDSDLIGAVDRLSAKLRERIGESLRSIRASEPLERVTTSSLEALELYTRAVRASDMGDLERSAALLEEAIRIDSMFAMGYRKLAVVLNNSFAPRSRTDPAVTKAFELRERLPPVERYLAEAYYYDNVEYDPAKVVAAYRSILEIDPEETTALNNLSIQLAYGRQWAESEELALRAIDVELAPTYFVNAVVAQLGQRKLVDAERTLALFDERLPDNPLHEVLHVFIAEAREDFAAAVAHLDTLDTIVGGSATWTSTTALWQAVDLAIRGRLADAKAAASRGAEISLEQRGDTSGYYSGVGLAAWIELSLSDRRDRALQMVDAAVSRYPWENLDPRDRPYSSLAQFYAIAGDVDRAKRLLSEYEAAVPEPLRRSDFVLHAARGAVAEAEGRLDDAAAHYRAWYDAGGECASCGLSERARVYDAMGQRDSALALYGRAAEIRGAGWAFDQMPYYGPNLKRLGELAEERGDTAKAVEYYDRLIDLWRDADPELQPIVDEVRSRLADLAGEG